MESKTEPGKSWEAAQDFCAPELQGHSWDRKAPRLTLPPNGFWLWLHRQCQRAGPSHLPQCAVIVKEQKNEVVKEMQWRGGLECLLVARLSTISLGHHIQGYKWGTEGAGLPSGNAMDLVLFPNRFWLWLRVLLSSFKWSRKWVRAKTGRLFWWFGVLLITMATFPSCGWCWQKILY